MHTPRFAVKYHQKKKGNHLVQPLISLNRKANMTKKFFVIYRHTLHLRKQVTLKYLAVTPLKSVTAAIKIYHKL